MTALLRFCLLVCAVTLTACGGSSGGSSGGGGGGNNGGDDITVPDDGGGVPEDGLAGRAAKGAIHSATVEASLWNGQGWTTLETTSTNSEGYFGLDIGAETAPVRILVTATPSSQMRCDAPAGCQSTAFGEFMTLPEGFQLSTIVPGDAIDPEGEIAVTPLTHIAARWTQEMPGGPTNAGAELALSRVAELFGLASDFALRLPVDVSDSSQLAEADDEGARHGLLSAAFAELAGQSGQDIAELLDGAAQMFSLLGGQVLLQSGELTAAEIEELILDLGGDPQELLGDIDLEDLAVAGLDALLASAISVANHVNQDGQQDALIADFDAMSTAISDSLLSQLVGNARFDSTDFDRAMVALDDFDTYMTLAQSLAPAEPESFAWLYADEDARADTEGAVTALAEALNFAVEGIGVAAARTGLGYYRYYNLETKSGSPTYSGYAVLDRHAGTLSTSDDFTVRINGSRHGQVVDLAMEIDHGADIINNQHLDLTISGTISNPTSVLELNLVLAMDLSQNDMTDLQETVDGAAWDVLFGAGDELNATLEAQLNELMDRLHTMVTITGSGEFVRASDDKTMYSFSGMDLDILYNACVVVDNELCLVNDGPLVDILLAGGERTNADGDQVFTLAGEDRFHLTVEEPVTLEVNYGSSSASGFPDMEVRVDGTLAGVEPLLQQLADAIGDETVDFAEIDFEALFNELDLSLLALDGELELTLIDDVEGNTVYTLTLTEGGVAVSLPNSSDNALTLGFAGAAGYIHAGDTLVGTLHPDLNDNGLSVALVDGDLRSYTAGAITDFSDAEALLEWLGSLLEQLMGEEPAE